MFYVKCQLIVLLLVEICRFSFNSNSTVTQSIGTLKTFYRLKMSTRKDNVVYIIIYKIHSILYQCVYNYSTVFWCQTLQCFNAVYSKVSTNRGSVDISNH